MTEFTGERVVPGQVEADLWNEHFGRYTFAARLSRMKRVLDAGCGMGYGSAELARVAASVVGVDIAGDAVASARQSYTSPRVTFLQGSCAALPFRTAAFDLVVAFEVIEHLREWRDFLTETRRVLAPGGQCLISTPNRDYYADSRGLTGPNPYHQHEFSFEEFRQELLAIFPHVALFLQNHVDGFVFQPAGHLTPAEARLDRDAGNPEESHFFLAVCALSPQTGSPTFLYVPRAANVLREREQHIEKLGEQVAEINQDRTQLLDLFRKQTQELEQQAGGYETKIAQLQQELAQRGAGYETQIAQLQKELEEQARGYETKVAQLQQELAQQGAGYETQIAQLQKELEQQASGYETKVAQLQQELAQQGTGYETQIAQLQQELQQQASGYQTKIAELEDENRNNAEWAVETERRLTLELVGRSHELEAKCQELAECVRVLHESEKTVEERTNWALQLEQELQQHSSGYESKIAQLHQELQQQASGYQTKIAELEDENRKNAEWAVQTERRLTQELLNGGQELESKCQELAECVRALHATESTVEERTNWALKLDAQIRHLEASLHLLRASRWVKLGSALGIGPRPRKR